MITWVHITLISGFTAVIIVLILILIRKKCSRPTMPQEIVITNVERCQKQKGEASFRQDFDLDDEQGSINKTSYDHVFKQRKAFFSWADYPSLVAQAVENGWPRFSFLATDHGNETNNHVEISWEVFEESADYMQKIRLNREVIKESICVIRAGLPLPGPQFANASFPKEAYFEIRILANHQDMENDEKNNLTSNKINEELKFKGKQECGDEMILVGIGLSTAGGSHLPLKMPGSFLGSVGFNSNGSVYLDGRKLVGESENEGWGRAGNVIGCGYNPTQKKVFFTVNSKLAYEIRCKTEEFSHPLHPTLAAANSSEVTIVVNLGQSPFKFEAANSERTPNPCFFNTRASCSAAAASPHYELDSKELFSLGRIDGKWKYWNNNGKRSSSESITGEYDHMSEADLFEIVAR